MQIPAALADRVARTPVPALALGISHRGDRSFACGGERPVTDRSVYRIASLTKPFTAAATILALTARGIPLSTPAVELLPGLAADWRADPAITVEQLLGQVAGLRPSVDATAMAALHDSAGALAEGARLVVRAGSERQPGQRWEYYNGNYFLLGALVASLVRASYEDALDQLVLRPLGLADTGFRTPADPVPGWDGQAQLAAADYPRPRRPSGGLWSSAGDLLTFAERILGDESLLDEIRRPRTRDGDPMTYGLGWALGPSGQLYLNGRLAGYRTAMVLVPQEQYASVALASETSALPEIAQYLSELQFPFTGDSLARRITEFAA